MRLAAAASLQTAGLLQMHSKVHAEKVLRRAEHADKGRQAPAAQLSTCALLLSHARALHSGALQQQQAQRLSAQLAVQAKLLCSSEQADKLQQLTSARARSSSAMPALLGSRALHSGALQQQQQQQRLAALLAVQAKLLCSSEQADKLKSLCHSQA